ncbi:MAG: hypothetical protein J5929_11145 [Eubacterium sp.]|nr:hypothetical protein [Eubacterium sp.]
MPTIEDIRNYYKSSLEKMVFFDKKTTSGINYYILYIIACRFISKQMKYAVVDPDNSTE